MGAVHSSQVRHFHFTFSAWCYNIFIDVALYAFHILYKMQYVVTYVFFRYHGIEVKDFGPSWRDGVAFQSVVHAIRPDLVDMEVVRRRSNRENLEEAFALAENELGIPRLLDPEGALDISCCVH